METGLNREPGRTKKRGDRGTGEQGNRGTGIVDKDRRCIDPWNEHKAKARLFGSIHQSGGVSSCLCMAIPFSALLPASYHSSPFPSARLPVS